MTSHPISEPYRRASAAARIREDMGVIVSRFVGRRVTGMGLVVVVPAGVRNGLHVSCV